MKTEIILLKSKLCGFEHIARKLNKKATGLRGEKKSYVKSVKREIGLKAREHMIAYALLRFKPYESIEQKCNNNPSAENILAIIHQHVSRYEARNWTIEKVKSLLTRSE